MSFASASTGAGPGLISSTPASSASGPASATPSASTSPSVNAAGAGTGAGALAGAAGGSSIDDNRNASNTSLTSSSSPSFPTPATATTPSAATASPAIPSSSTSSSLFRTQAAPGPGPASQQYHQQQQQHAHAAQQLTPRTPTTASTSLTTNPVLHPNLPSPSSPQHTAQARAALVGTIENLLDSELQSRAGLLHQNARALEAQERDVAKATEALRRENDKLVKVVKEGSRRVLETGNVQNWAEVLERDFLVLEDTLRQVRRGDSSAAGCSDPDCSGCSCGSASASASWSGSEAGGSRRASLDQGPGPGTAAGGGDTVEDVIVGGAAAAGTSEAMDVDTEDTGKKTPEPGERDGTFASVGNAIAASISEAMATAMGDVATPPESRLPSASPGLEPEARDKGKQAERVGDSDVPELSQMQVDSEDGHNGQEARTLGDTDVKALEAIDLGLEPALGGTSAMKTIPDSTAHHQEPGPNITPGAEADTLGEDSMDVDDRGGAEQPGQEPSRLDETAGRQELSAREATVAV
ncbi:uncharacterized protein JN550_005866 [Neoarthrinium moseri]|uniref:uncharacterized protein n=1 Tax=Neoarthrinium moseri TaxID=1658444 RepID=UPI001FDD4DDC|nr:uncharacterized protein JN550_005866 [Neoarthrinium moseri]KAI1869236.1 hypothetical protein JN550_005866 [Neoarthrinium moseri]